MGMASSDDEEAIARDHSRMERIKRNRTSYHEETEHMTEDQKAIHDDALLRKYNELFHPNEGWDD